MGEGRKAGTTGRRRTARALRPLHEVHSRKGWKQFAKTRGVSKAGGRRSGTEGRENVL